MNGRVVFGGLLLVLGMAGRAHADPYMMLGDGLVFNASYTTQGIFTCGSVLPCSGTGTNTVTIGSGSSAVTISFAGVSTTAVVGNVAAPVPLGSFTAVAMDPAFTFPTHPNPNVRILDFTLSMTQSSPAAGAASRFMTFGPGGSTDLPLLEMPITYFAFPTGPNPPGFNYNQIVYSFPIPFSIRANELTPLEAQAGVIPEPATLALMASGLGFIAAARQRRRRRRL